MLLMVLTFLTPYELRSFFFFFGYSLLIMAGRIGLSLWSLQHNIYIGINLFYSYIFSCM